MSRIASLFKTFSPRTWRQLVVAFLIFAVPVFGFAQLADEVREQDTLRFDEAVLRAVNTLATPTLDAAVIGLTQLGGPVGVVVLTAGLTGLFWFRNMRRFAAQLMVGVGGAVLLNVLLKTVFQRDRPQLWERIVTENSYSFPSGHAMASSALAFSAIVLFWPTKWRWPVLVVSLLYMLVIAFTRLYLGVHYPTDILAGWLVSGAWVAVVATIIRYRIRLLSLLERN